MNKARDFACVRRQRNDQFLASVVIGMMMCSEKLNTVQTKAYVNATVKGIFILSDIENRQCNEDGCHLRVIKTESKEVHRNAIMQSSDYPRFYPVYLITSTYI